MNKLTPAEQKTFWLLQLMRAGAAFALTWFFADLIDTGTDSFLLALTAAVACLVAGNTALKEKSLIKTFCFYTLLIVAALIAEKIGNYLSASFASPENLFVVEKTFYTLELLFLIYAVFYLCTLLFWKSPHTQTFETLVLASGLIFFLNAHRDYQLGAPKKVSSLAWSLGLELQHLILFIGAGAALLFAVYIYIGTNRPLIGKSKSKVSKGKRTLLSALSSVLLLLLLSLYTYVVHTNYQADFGRSSEGVGNEKEQGKSPLGFHSAVGKTKQPAALMRLETDYPENPTAPMLYLREGALSEFDGKELVIASPQFDTDVPRIAPGQSLNKTISDAPGRKEVTYSVFLLTDQATLFGIDFPVSARSIKNPDDDRFRVSYQAVSLAPVISLDAIGQNNVFDPSWSSSEREHYLRAPGTLTEEQPATLEFKEDTPELDSNGEDLRYKKMALLLTKDAPSPIAKAASIAQFLSEKSIYTRTPGHQATERGDPVAAYLFAEKMRGYCVHFAHAAVYLMRLAGVPARIGTGYLTDLSYSKDGHILLHLGDRHAWPEIYVDGYGWVVLDVQPSQAENEQELIPDEKLLEELMSKIDPAEEFLNPLPPLEETKPSLEVLEHLANKKLWAGILAALAGIFILLKLWLRFGFMVVSNQLKTKLAFQSISSLLIDLGYPRALGETRREYTQRVLGLGVSLAPMSTTFEKAKYGRDNVIMSGSELSQILKTSSEKLNLRHVWLKKIIAFFNPSSILRWRSW